MVLYYMYNIQGFIKDFLLGRGKIDYANHTTPGGGGVWGMLVDPHHRNPVPA